MTPAAEGLAMRPVAWSMVEREPETWRMAAGREKPTIDVFAPYWSTASSTALEEIRRLEADFELVIHYDDTRYPEWVRERASKLEGGGYPLLWWTTEGAGHAVAWSSAVRFCQAFEATTVPAPVIASPAGGYPIHRQRWHILGNWQPSLEQLLEHLVEHPNHRGKVDPAWFTQIAALPQGREMLLSFHDDDHEGRVKWEYVRRLDSISTTAVAARPVTAGRAPLGGSMPQPTMPVYRTTRCPGGRCPTGGILSRWLKG
jgi:hypothetical protein